MLRRPSRAPWIRVAGEPLEPRRLFAAIPGFVETEFVAGGINRAVQMDFAPDGRLFVTQQDGNLRVVKGGQLLPAPFVTVPVHNTGESGLLGVTFDPDFATNQYLYIYYTYKDAGTGAYWNRVSRFTASGDAAAPGSEVVLLETDPLGPGTWHNAGGMKFGPDGKLYIGVGENQQREPAQSLGSLLGKVLRINADGSIPEDNPFYNATSGKYRAIWAYGFRNPFTFDVQAGTGRIFVNDVGSSFWEEINELKKGANYGWPGSEGAPADRTVEMPLYTYPHAGGDFDDAAIAGAAFYDGPVSTFPADYAGDFFFGDFGTGEVKRMDAASLAVETFANGHVGITDVDVGPDGALYYLLRAASGGPNGRVLRVAPTVAGSAPTISVQPQSQNVTEGTPVTFSVAVAGDGLTYQWSRDGVDIPGATGATYTVPAATVADSGGRFRVIVVNAFGATASVEAVLTVVEDTPPVASFDPASGGPWVGGGTVSFSGSGIDAEDGILPASAFTWSVELHHDTHSHPFVAPYSGVTSDTIEIPDAGHDAEHNIWYRVHLTVTDSGGLSHSTFQDMFPQKVNLSLRTDPPGLPLQLDGAEVATPYDSPAIVGFRRSLVAPATQTVNGVQYTFAGWDDGTSTGAARELSLPAQGAVYTARYRVATPLGVELRASVPPAVMPGSRLGGKSVVGVTNIAGRTVSGPTTVRLLLVRADDPDLEVAEVGSVTKALTLAPGATKTLKLAMATMPMLATGNYLLVARAVAPDGSPSRAQSGTPVTVLDATLDLAGLEVEPLLGPEVARRNEKVKLTVQNRGTVPVQGPVTVTLVASTDTAFGDDDVVLTRLPATLRLAPGRTATLKFNVTFPPNLLPGFYSVVAVIDPDNVLGEDDATRGDNVVIGRRSIRAS